MIQRICLCVVMAYSPLYACQPPTQPSWIGDGINPSFLSLAIWRGRSGGQLSPYDNTVNFNRIFIYNFNKLSHALNYRPSIVTDSHLNRYEHVNSIYFVAFVQVSIFHVIT